MWRIVHSRVTRKIERLAHTRKIKQKSTVMEPSNPFQTLNELVDAEENTDEKTGTLGLPLEEKPNIKTGKQNFIFCDFRFYSCKRVYTNKLNE